MGCQQSKLIEVKCLAMRISSIRILMIGMLVGVENMCDMFNLCKDFNQLEKWDKSSVSSMKGMFCNAYSFNQPINQWNVENVTEMSNMFCSAISLLINQVVFRLE